MSVQGLQGSPITPSRAGAHMHERVKWETLQTLHSALPRLHPLWGSLDCFRLRLWTVPPPFFPACELNFWAIPNP